MLLRNMPQHKIALGTHKRADGEAFEVSAVLYESPASIDFWQVPIDTQHATWGHMRFVLTIPKKIADTVQLATVLIRGSVFDQVKATLATATASGRDLAPCFSMDGWVLV